jgi:glycosyltransferase involved in cell wall biosynthesis
MTRRIIALLGRKDEPTDAVEEYCGYLGVALEKHDFLLQIFRVAWDKDGWNEALKALKLQAADWGDTWVLVQYTALAWSVRGFPRKVLGVLETLKEGSARVGIVYHDVESYPGSRVLDKIRRVSQLRAMRDALSLADAGVFTVALDHVSWVSKTESKAHFIPVGPNLPVPKTVPSRSVSVELPSVAVFSITGGQAGEQETRTILAAVRHAVGKIGRLRLSVFGRNAELREKDLRDGLRDLPVEISVDGVIEPQQVVEKLRASDVLLFVRGTISSRRGSAIAGIACGLPVIAYPGSETASPITDAGVVLVPYGHPDALNAALIRVLSDTAYRTDLANRSRAVYQTHLSWPVIAARLCALLDNR